MTRIAILGCMLAASLLPAHVPAAPAQAAEGGPAVVMSFGWPPGMEAAVVTQSTRTRIAEQRSTVTATQQYRLRVMQEGGHLVIRFSDVAVKVKADPPPARLSREQQLQPADAGTLMPEYRVSEGGRFLGVVDVGEFQAKLKAHFGRLVPKGADDALRRSLAGALQTAGSVPALNAAAEQHWQGIVGAWVGARLEIGREYTRQAAEPLPVLPGERIQMNYVFAARRMLPCTPQSTDERCVELEVVSSADTEDVARIVGSLAGRTIGAPGQPTVALKALEVRNVLRLVAEPDGLIPHRSSISQHTKGLALINGKPQPIEQTSVSETTYTYR